MWPMEVQSFPARMHDWRLSHIHGHLAELEAAIAKGETILADPGLYTADPQKFATISKGLENARAEKDAAEERWLELAELIEG